MHYCEIYDETGDLSELIPFCSDTCHREWCSANGQDYGGWNGSYRGGCTEYCANCGVVAHVGADDEDTCECLRNNVVVNRFTTDEGEQCEHGNYLQLPRSRMMSA